MLVVWLGLFALAFCTVLWVADRIYKFFDSRKMRKALAEYAEIEKQYPRYGEAKKHCPHRMTVTTTKTRLGHISTPLTWCRVCGELSPKKASS